MGHTIESLACMVCNSCREANSHAEFRDVHHSVLSGILFVCSTGPLKDVQTSYYSTGHGAEVRDQLELATIQYNGM